jgi:hypothetical protein
MFSNITREEPTTRSNSKSAMRFRRDLVLDFVNRLGFCYKIADECCNSTGAETRFVGDSKDFGNVVINTADASMSIGPNSSYDVSIEYTVMSHLPNAIDDGMSELYGFGMNATLHLETGVITCNVDSIDNIDGSMRHDCGYEHRASILRIDPTGDFADMLTQVIRVLCEEITRSCNHLDVAPASALEITLAKRYFANCPINSGTVRAGDVDELVKDTDNVIKALSSVREISEEVSFNFAGGNAVSELLAEEDTDAEFTTEQVAEHVMLFVTCAKAWSPFNG